MYGVKVLLKTSPFSSSSSTGATVHDELRPLLRLLFIDPDPLTFVSNF
jgi:hypothetical protein